MIMEDVFLRVLNMGITAGYCVLVLLFVRLFLKKLPKMDVAINTGLAQAAPTAEASVNPMQVIVYGATVIWGAGRAVTV